MGREGGTFMEDTAAPSEGVPPPDATPAVERQGQGGVGKPKQQQQQQQQQEQEQEGSKGSTEAAGGGEGPPAGVAALFEAALAEGVLQEREAAGMMKGVMAQLSSGKQTEAALVAQTAKRIQGIRQKAEKKRQQAEKKAANKKQQAEAKRQREAAVPQPAELLTQLADPDEATQLLAARNVAAASLKLKGRSQRKFQDAMVPGLDALVAMTTSAQDARRTAAFDALHRLLMYQRRGCTAVADTSIIPTITQILQDKKRVSRSPPSRL
eukprot:COSAG02_NODE_16356_length_1090_cov_1.262361_1_plen_266_part_01